MASWPYATASPLKDDCTNGVTLFVDVRNVFDERYVSNVSAITNARTMATTVFFPGDARSVYAGLSFGF